MKDDDTRHLSTEDRTDYNRTMTQIDGLFHLLSTFSLRSERAKKIEKAIELLQEVKNEILTSKEIKSL